MMTGRLFGPNLRGGAHDLEQETNFSRSDRVAEFEFYLFFAIADFNDLYRRLLFYNPFCLSSLRVIYHNYILLVKWYQLSD